MSKIGTEYTNEGLALHGPFGTHVISTFECDACHEDHPVDDIHEVLLPDAMGIPTPILWVGAHAAEQFGAVPLKKG